MDDVDCSVEHEVLDQCSFRGWRVHDCQHRDDVGVICWPGEWSEFIISPFSSFIHDHAPAEKLLITFKLCDFSTPVLFFPLFTPVFFQISHPASFPHVAVFKLAL